MAVIKAVTVTNPAIVFLMKFINGLGSFDESLPHALLISGNTIWNNVWKTSTKKITTVNINIAERINCDVVGLAIKNMFKQ